MKPSTQTQASFWKEPMIRSFTIGQGADQVKVGISETSISYMQELVLVTMEHRDGMDSYHILPEDLGKIAHEFTAFARYMAEKD